MIVPRLQHFDRGRIPGRIFACFERRGFDSGKDRLDDLVAKLVRFVPIIQRRRMLKSGLGDPQCIGIRPLRNRRQDRKVANGAVVKFDRNPAV